jgi:hypothetical protein
MSFIKLGGVYLRWSSIVDAPTALFESIEEIREYLLSEHGRAGLADFDRSGEAERIERTGVSSIRRETPEDVVWLNRAGRNGTCLTVPQLVEFYCRRRGVGEAPVGLNQPPCYERRNATDRRPICGKCGCQDSEDPS